MNVPATHNLPEYSVSEISGAIKRSLEDQFGYIRIRGEISGWKIASSGHCYFCLKDANALISAVSWRSSLAKLSFKPEDGLEVVASGKITTYPGRSNYQIIVDKLEPAGAGALMALLEQRKKQLALEGLFAPERKKPLPYLPETIGIITSPTGAVIRDILHRLGDRFPVNVLIWPVAVQGEGAVEQITAAIQGFNAMPSPPDLLIVARGGGSIEDLWAFNEELVVRSAAASRIPLISAVGHETDTTLIDFVSDRRAPTPTAAAEMAVPVRSELQAQMAEITARLTRAVSQQLCVREEKLISLLRGLPRPAELMQQAVQRLDNWSERHQATLPALLAHKAQQLAIAVAKLTPQLLKKDLVNLEEKLSAQSIRLTPSYLRLLQYRGEKLMGLARLLETVSYTGTLRRGFALVKSQGNLVTSAGQAKQSTTLELLFHDGEVSVYRKS